MGTPQQDQGRQPGASGFGDFTDIDLKPEYGKLGNPWVRGYAEFCVSDNAPIDIPVDSCFPVTNTFIDGERNTLQIGSTVTSYHYILFNEENSQPEPKSCAANVNSALAGRVTVTMLAIEGCVVWAGEVDGLCPIKRPGYYEDRAAKLGAGTLLAALLPAGLERYS